MLTSRQKALIRIAKETPDRIIKNEDGLWEEFALEFVRILDDEGNEVNFILREEQRRFMELYWAAKREGRQFRAICLKPRQIGFSSLVCVLFAIETCLNKNSETLIASNVKDGSGENLFEKHVFIHRNMPQNVGKQDNRIFAKGGLPGGGSIQMMNSKSKVKLVGERPEVGSTYSGIHVSEASHYHDFAEFMTHLRPSIRTGDNKTIIIESTGKVFGDAYNKEWDDAMIGKGGWETFFTPWYQHSLYTKQIPSSIGRDKFISMIGKQPREYGNEKHLMAEYKLTPEQMYWRRDAIDESRSIAKFQLNYPATPEEASGSGDTPIFHIPSLNYYRKMCEEPITVGRMECEEGSGLLPDGSQDSYFVENIGGAIEVWEEPEVFEQYVWASDHAEGLPSRDSNVALIAKRNPFKIVAKIKGNDMTKLQTLEFARQLTYMLKWYNRPKGLPECNNQGSAILLHLEDWGYNDCVLWENEVKPDTRTVRKGYFMTAPSKKAGFDLLVDTMRVSFEVDEETGDNVGKITAKYAPLIPDEETINELYHVVTDGKKIQARNKGKSRAIGSNPTGYSDDLAVTLMLLVLAQKSLPEPMTLEENMVAQLGHNHPLTDGLEHIKIYDPIAEMNKPISEGNMLY